MRKEYYNNSGKVDYVYGDITKGVEENANAPLTMILDSYAGIEYNIYYDGNKNASKIGYLSGAYTGSITYDKDGAGRLGSTNYLLSGDSMKQSYAYDAQGRAKQTKLVGKFDSEYLYDGWNRLKSRKLSLVSGKKLFEETYLYEEAVNANGQKTGVTRYVSKIERKIDGVVHTADSYTYDKNGNITGITNKQGAFVYAYDEMNRVTSEWSSPWGEFKTHYTYDAGGNITSKSLRTATGEIVINVPYVYGDSVWKDKLTSFGGQSITYDNAGNPTSYLGATLSWTRGRMLNSYSKSGTNCSYTYNYEGLRTKKVANGVTHQYWLEGSRIVKEANGSGTFLYYYDETGICGFSHNGTPYYFQKNLMGDVTHIYNASGVMVGSYTYNAWGVCTVGTNTSNIATHNPFRYRGYYLDVETGLYYLQTRYYDPEVGRFINADTVGYLDLESINGLNLYAYCGNNPVMRADPTGHAWW